MALPQHNGSVYKHKSKNNWKESWLCVETDGKLTWKKSDAYEVKGVAYVNDILDHIQITGWPAKKCAQNNNATPFLMRLPIEVHGSKTNKTLILKSGGDLDLWLDAFATVVGKWKLWKTCKQRQAIRIAKQKAIDERSVESQLKYEEQVEFYKGAWAEFLDTYKKEPADTGSQNGHVKPTTTNTAVHTFGAQSELRNGDRNGAVARQLYAPNGLPPNQDQSTSPPSYDYAEIDHSTQQKSQATTSVTTVTVHHEIQKANNAQVVANGEVLGEEDDGEELHF